MKRRKIALLLAGLMAASMLAGCSSDAGNGNSGSGSSGSGDSGNGDSGSEAITVITREDGSGTRGAFVELTGVEADGEDQTTEEAVVANQTEAVITQVSGDPAAIGYISLGSLNDTVKALKVEGVEATPENVKNGTYTVARPFYIATKGEATGVAADFISFIMSKQGQEIVSDGYIAVNDGNILARTCARCRNDLDFRYLYHLVGRVYSPGDAVELNHSYRSYHLISSLFQCNPE